MFVDQLLLEDVLVFTADYYLTYAKKNKNVGLLTVINR